METNLFQNLQQLASTKGVVPYTKSAQNWFRRKVQDLKTINRNQLLQDSKLSRVNKPMPGQMFMYFYDPKHKKTLPYYDRFPLIIMVDEAPGGFYGLNLHYLPPHLRARFFDALMDTLNNRKYDETTNFQITYKMLKSVAKMKYFKSCYKHYLSEHVYSRIVRVEPAEWDIALFLPTQHFQKASASTVWSDAKGY